jgi:hypothetical protein
MEYTIIWEPLQITEYSYASVVRLLPKVLSSSTIIKVEHWGFTITNSSCELFYFNRGGLQKQKPWFKTSSVLFIREVIKALLLLVEYGVVQKLDSEGITRSKYLEILEEVNSVHPLTSYVEQKNYFIDISLKKCFI